MNHLVYSSVGLHFQSFCMCCLNYYFYYWNIKPIIYYIHKFSVQIMQFCKAKYIVNQVDSFLEIKQICLHTSSKCLQLLKFTCLQCFHIVSYF